VTGQETAAGVFIASGNLTGDATSEVFFSTGAGIPSALHVASLGGNDVITHYPFGTESTNGLHLAVGNVDGFGYPELMVGEGRGGGRLRIYSMNGNDLVLRMDGEPMGPGFTGGVFPAVIDLNNDGTDELVVAPASGPPVVRAFNFKIAETTTPRPAPRLIFNYNVFDESKTNGVRIALGVSEGDVVLAATTGSEVKLEKIPTARDPWAVLYHGAPFGVGTNVTTIDVKTPPSPASATSPR
jgi:hypothetical protein